MKVSEIIISDNKRLLDEIAGNPFVGKFYKYYINHHRISNDFVYPVDQMYSPDAIYVILETLYDYNMIISTIYKNHTQLVSMINEMLDYFNK
jgi:hypothetical protein